MTEPKRPEPKRPEPRRSGSVAAVDLGATSGRVILGRVQAGRLSLRPVSRFPNVPVRTRDGLHWNILELYRQVTDGLAAAVRAAPGEIASAGIDSWAVDYGLLRGGALAGVPYHYRDDRNDAGVAAVHAIVPPDELYRRNGLQHLRFNTLFQLAADRAAGALDGADRLLLVPDLLGYWLTGAQVAERTNASTTGLLDPRTRAWDVDLVKLLGLPPAILPPLVDPGADLGAMTAEVAEVVGQALPLTAVGSHDTASAVAAIPNTGGGFAYISCGTWGLVGLELEAPVITEAARAANFTNEGGVDGTVRFLHNVMGLWLLSECVRSWTRGATAAQRVRLQRELLQQSAAAPPPAAVFDVNDPRFLPPGDMPGRIERWYAERGLAPPASQPEFVRCVIESLAAAFADAVADAARLAGQAVTVIHIVGGGARNELLCQAVADRSGLPVAAGPVEATAIGNVLLQARAAGLASGDLAALRALVVARERLRRFTPRTASGSTARR